MSEDDPLPTEYLSTQWFVDSGMSWLVFLFLLVIIAGMVGHICLFITLRFSLKGLLWYKVSYRLLVYQLLTDYVWCLWLLSRAFYGLYRMWIHPEDGWISPFSESAFSAKVFCDTEGVVLFMCAQSSLYNTLLIAYDRYRMITQPLTPLHMGTAMKYYAASLVLAASQAGVHATDFMGGYKYTKGELYCFIDLWNQKANMYCFTTLMLPVIVSTGLCYFKIWKTIQERHRKQEEARRNAEMTKKQSSGFIRSNADGGGERKEKQLAVKMFALFIWWCVCWTPAVIMLFANSWFIENTAEGLDTSRLWALVTATGCVVNAASNPLLCFVMMASVRHAAADMLRCKPIAKKQPRMGGRGGFGGGPIKRPFGSRMDPRKRGNSAFDTFNPMREEEKKTPLGKVKESEATGLRGGGGGTRAYLTRALTFKPEKSELEESETPWRSQKNIKRQEKAMAMSKEKEKQMLDDDFAVKSFGGRDVESSGGKDEAEEEDADAAVEVTTIAHYLRPGYGL
jgi:hypothetical protein